jgi:hypothetical protein
MTTERLRLRLRKNGKKSEAGKKGRKPGSGVNVQYHFIFLSRY